MDPTPHRSERTGSTQVPSSPPGLPPAGAQTSQSKALQRKDFEQDLEGPSSKALDHPPGGGGAARRNSSSLFIIAVSQPRTPLPKPATEAQSSDLTVPALGTHGTTLRLHPKFLIPSASALCKRKGCGPGRPQGRGTAEGHCVPPSPPPLAHTPWTHHSSAQLCLSTPIKPKPGSALSSLGPPCHPEWQGDLPAAGPLPKGQERTGLVQGQSQEHNPGLPGVWQEPCPPVGPGGRRESGARAGCGPKSSDVQHPCPQQ